MWADQDGWVESELVEEELLGLGLLGAEVCEEGIDGALRKLSYLLAFFVGLLFGSSSDSGELLGDVTKCFILCRFSMSD